MCDFSPYTFLSASMHIIVGYISISAISVYGGNSCFTQNIKYTT